MVALTTYTVLPALARSRQNDVAKGESGKHRSSMSGLSGEGDMRVEILTVVEQGPAGQSALPNLTLEDVLEHQGVVVIAADETISESSALIVTMEASGSSEAPVEVALVSGSDIEALYTRAGVETPGSTQTRSSNILLLKSGWAYLSLKVSPLELPSAPLAESISEHWSPWRQNDSGLHEIQDVVTGLWSRLIGTRVDTSAKTHEDTSGVYRTAEMSETQINTFTSWHDLELSPEGLFSVSQTTLVSGGGFDPDNSFVLQVANSIIQRSSTFSGLTRSEAGASATVSEQRNQLTEHVADLFGSWEILEDGVTLELRFADGRVERRLFLQAQSGENLSINGDTWWRNADASSDLLQRLFRLLTDPDNNRERASWASILAKVELLGNRKQKAPEPDAGFGVAPIE